MRPSLQESSILGEADNFFLEDKQTTVNAPVPLKPLLIVISGPSGVGKDAILHGMKLLSLSLFLAVTVTTRPKREREINGKDYYFISKNEFERMKENDELLEWSNVYGNFYGVPRSGLRQALARGVDSVVKVDVQGAAYIKSIVPEAVFIFVAPPSIDDLVKRLHIRKTETDVDLQLRMEEAQREMKHINMFDYVVINKEDQLDLAVSQIEAIIIAEKCRIKARSVEI